MTEINFGNTKGARMARGEKLTNFEIIKSMSVEEMAEMIDKIDCTGGVLDKICTLVNPEQNCSDENINCVKCIKKWLESEATE